MSSYNTAKIIIRLQKINSLGKAPLALQVFVGGERKVMSLNVTVEPSFFDAVAQKVKIPRDTEGSRRINALIQKRLTEANDIFFNFNYQNTALSLSEFMQQCARQMNRDSFSDFEIGRASCRERV